MGAGARFPVFRSVWRAYRDTLGRPVSLAKVAALPILASVLSIAVVTYLPIWSHPAAGLSLAAFIIPLCYLSLTWLRHSLMGLPARLAPQGVTLSSYGKLLVHCLLWSLLILVLPGLVLIGAGRLFLSLVARPWEYMPYLGDGDLAGSVWLILVALTIIPTSRLFLAAPAIAADKPVSPRAAWRLGKGLGLRLGTGLVILAVSLLTIESLTFFALVFGVISLLELLGIDSAFLMEDSFGEGIAVTLLGVDMILRTLVGSELVALAYRHATGWQAGRQEILERFE